MIRKSLFILFFISSINIIGCFNSKNIPKEPEKTCLVLSVGGFKGIAHIGAIKALKDLNIEIDYVYGNSFGSLVGGLYAYHPKGNLKKDLKRVVDIYIDETKKEKEKKAKSGFLFGAFLAVISGGILGWETMLGSTLISYLSVDDFDNKRFQKVLDKHFQYSSIEDLPIPFATSYHVYNREGISLKTISTGNLATSIGRSSNNPFIFLNTELNYIDPGIDRMAASPIADAIKHFNPTKVIAINVTGKPSIYPKTKNVKVVEILVDFDQKMNESFEEIDNPLQVYVKLGYDAVINKLK